MKLEVDEAKVISARQLTQNTILNLKKKFKFLGFHAVVIVKTFPLMY